MKDKWPGGRREEWIAYLRAVERTRAADWGGDGMTLASGLVPFGAGRHGEAVEASRLARAVSADEWEPGQALGAECGRGAYRVEVRGGS